MNSWMHVQHVSSSCCVDFNDAWIHSEHFAQVYFNVEFYFIFRALTLFFSQASQYDSTDGTAKPLGRTDAGSDVSSQRSPTVGSPFQHW